MKLAVSGKGGVGKTTIAALTADELVRRGYRVTAIDADPNPTLAPVLGFPPVPVTPLLEMKEEIEQRVGGSDGFVRLNPRIDDLVERVTLEHRGIQLIVAGAITRGGAGCACPQSVLLRRLLEHLVLEREEAVIIDLEAGLEHLGRRSAHAADALLVVVDPSRGSLDTAGRIRRLAGEIGIAQVLAVANRIRSPADLAYITEHLHGIPIAGQIPYSETLCEAERAGTLVVDETVEAAARRLVDALETRCGGRISQ
ncbi:MAG: AAA family ATPase [Armatimonadota bacterium]|nr:AAA family ATPase [Armatimonadota bacterium]